MSCGERPQVGKPLQNDKKLGLRRTKDLCLSNLASAGGLFEGISQVQGDDFPIVGTIEDAVGEDALHEDAEASKGESGDER